MTGTVWNSTLKRRKAWNRAPFVGKKRRPIKREIKARKPIKQRSSKQAQRDAKYAPISKAHLAAFPWCGICAVRDRGQVPATEIHHARGRAGSLLFDRRFFVSSCFECRMWPHENPEAARALGVLASATDWNRTEKHPGTALKDL